MVAVDLIYAELSRNMSKSRGIPCYIISSSDDDFSEVSDSYNGILIKN